MMKTMSHWGILAECEGAGAASLFKGSESRVEPAIILTPAGELLVHKTPEGEALAILVDRRHGGLTEAQQQHMDSAWRTATFLLGDEANLTPVPHSFRYARANYLSLDEWQSHARPNISKQGNHKEGGQSWIQCS
jgi:hypothetical protein